MQRVAILHVLVFGFALVALQQSVRAAATVINFDDLPDRYILTGTSYAGLTWEIGISSIDGSDGLWGVGGDWTHSAPRSAVNAGGTTQLGITFPSPVDLSGAYFATQGNLGPVSSVRVHEFLNGVEVDTTAWLSLTTTSTWLDMSSSSHVDRILLESVPVVPNAGPYSMDDLTFTYVPEPGSLSLLTLGGVLFLRRRR